MSNMNVMLDNVLQVLMETHSVMFNPDHHRIHCLAYVINLSARKLIDSLYITVQYEDEVLSKKLRILKIIC